MQLVPVKGGKGIFQDGEHTTCQANTGIVAKCLVVNADGRVSDASKKAVRSGLNSADEEQARREEREAKEEADRKAKERKGGRKDGRKGGRKA